MTRLGDQLADGGDQSGGTIPGPRTGACGSSGPLACWKDRSKYGVTPGVAAMVVSRVGRVRPAAGRTPGSGRHAPRARGSSSSRSRGSPGPLPYDVEFSLTSTTSRIVVRQCGDLGDDVVVADTNDPSEPPKHRRSHPDAIHRRDRPRRSPGAGCRADRWWGRPGGGSDPVVPPASPEEGAAIGRHVTRSIPRQNALDRPSDGRIPVEADDRGHLGEGAGQIAAVPSARHPTAITGRPSVPATEGRRWIPVWPRPRNRTY